ncbi:MAG TPA: 30S ribosome-binding factor RbfA [Ktedonobacterales bacterium]|nr:30S ribosome-binding factor RbfA [Ktedonobacterales bacterium]
MAHQTPQHHRRKDQLSHLIAHELSDLIARMKDPRIGFASVTGVDLSQDLRHAKVYISVMGSADEQRASMAALTHATGFLRRELAQRLTIRYTPELAFRLDDSIARGAHVLDLINQTTAQQPTAGAQPAPQAPNASE